MAAYERDDTKRLMSRVQKLLTLANDGGATEGERDNAMRMAHALLAKHNLDLAVCMASGKEGQELADSAEPRTDTIATFGAWPWALQTCNSIADLFFCKYLWSKGRSAHFGNHYFIGRTSNATTAALVAEYVVKSIRSEATRRMRAQGERWAFHRSFCQGAARMVAERVRELKERSTTSDEGVAPGESVAPGSALVLASVYEKEVALNEQYIEKRWGETAKARRSRAKAADDYNGLAQGRAFGKTVSLKPQIK